MNRGWIPQRNQPDKKVIDQPSGAVRVVGVLQPGRDKKPPIVPAEPDEKQYYWLDLKSISKNTGAEPLLIEAHGNRYNM